MSFGEIINLYRDGDIVIHPEFQRLFRWTKWQKSRLIESILLGIPIPSIFVFETPEGKWELVDGLQRTSTVLEFVGILRNIQGESMPPSYLMATAYLPSLENMVWEKSSSIEEIEYSEQVEMAKSLQLAVKRARVGVEILKRPSDPHTKYELFQRLNSGGTRANPQELRNCLIVMVYPALLRQLRAFAEQDFVKAIFHSSEEQRKSQRDIEMLTRFLVYRYVPYNGKLDVEEYIDKGIVSVAETGLYSKKAASNMQDTFLLLYQSLGDNALKQYTDGSFKGRVGLTALEIVAVGVSHNLSKIKRLNDPEDFISQRVIDLWSNDDVREFSRAGLRGTQRIQQTSTFGETWFRPQ